MGIELVIFIASILFGILLFWRESNSNKTYRFVNKLVNSKELQMKPGEKKGFIYKQSFLPRLVFITFSFLFIAVIIQFVTPIEIFTSFDGISVFCSIVVGTVLGTYLANFVLKSGKIVDEKSESLTDLVSGTIEKGKELLDDITTKDDDVSSSEVETSETPKAEEPPKQEKSARERLKDKGLL